jgi:hypothetical protein
LQNYHPHNARQWRRELAKSNGQELWAAVVDGRVRIEGTGALQRLATSMSNARQNHWATLVWDLLAVCTSVYHQLSNQKGGTYDHRVDASTWDWMNSVPPSALRRESTAYAGVVLDTDGSMKWHRQKKQA